MRKTKVMLGDVFQISLPNGQFAYGRVYKDASVGIYRKITDEPNQPPIGSRDFWFNVGLYADVLEQRTWPIIGRDEFSDTESPWPPPKYVKDLITSEYQIYHHGELRKAVETEVVGLEETAVWDADHVIKRIMSAIEPQNLEGRYPF